MSAGSSSDVLVKNTYYLFFTFLLFSSCSTQKVFFDKLECRGLNPDRELNFLETVNAVDGDFSILLFTDGHFESNLVVSNENESFYDGKLKKSNIGLSGVIRVSNKLPISINFENKTTIVLKAKYLKKYKYTYIGKNNLSRKPNYEITYSNILRGFK